MHAIFIVPFVNILKLGNIFQKKKYYYIYILIQMSSHIQTHI